ncbi:MAG: WxcM-like domain-containing protein [Rhodobacteraceae bacterium]|nr:WxcM-like domain-containing protein [Paracoccaceae bacterium]
MASVDDCQLIDVRSVFDHRGAIAIIEGGMDIPFEIARVYMTYDIPTNATRAGHAHRALQQLYIAASGAFDVVLDDGQNTRTVTLRHPAQALYLGPGIWREIRNFSVNASLLVLASLHYDEADYVRDHGDFLQLANAGAFDDKSA